METMRKAIELMENNEAEQALQLLNTFLQTANDDEKYAVADLYLQWGLIHEARDLIQELLEEYPYEGELKLLLAEIYTEVEQDEKAIQLLDEITEGDGAYIPALIQLADLYQVQGLFEVAEQKLLTAKQLEPNEMIIDFALGELYFSIGEFKKATTFYERVMKQTNEIGSISLTERLAESYARIGEYETALVFFEKSDDSNSDILFQYGLTAHQAKRNDIAIRVLEKVIKEDIYYHSAYYYLATVYEGEERIDEAYQTAVKGLKVDEFNKELFFYAGKLAHKLGKHKTSEELIREAITLDGDYKEPVLFLISLFKEQDKFEDIIDLILYLKDDMEVFEPEYEWELARSYYEIEEYKYALKHYREAYNSLQHDDDFLKEFGYFLTEEGEIKEAITVFELYLNHQPLDDEIAEYVSRLKAD